MDSTIKVGDFMTDTYDVYEITAIKNEDGKEMVFYQPIGNLEKGYTARIPIDNIHKAGIRKTLTKAEADSLLDSIKAASAAVKYDFNSAKEVIFQNNPEKTIPVLTYIWINQENLPKSDKDLMEQIVDNLSREMSFVYKKETTAIKDMIYQKLGKIKKEKTNGVTPVYRNDRGKRK